MAGPKTIQRLPVGLLDILGMQSTGDTPHLIADEVQPVMDLTDLYLTDRLSRSIAQTAVIAAIGFAVAGTVTPLGPAPGEQWMVYGLMTSSGALAAATQITYVMAVSRTSLAAGAQYLTRQQVVANPNIFAEGLTFERPLILRPGDQLGIFVSQLTAAPAIAPFVSAFYVPVRV